MPYRLNIKRWICRFIIILILTPVLMLYPIYANAAGEKTYVALGDSIAYGMDANSKKGYVDLFHNYLKSLKKYKGMGLINLSRSGDASTDLVNTINNNEDKIKNASVITISIGGNNITYPIITGVAKLFNVDYINDPNFIDKLLTVIETDPDAQLKLISLLFNQNFQSSLSNGVTNFSKDWTTIIDKVKALAPEADIYVTTVYNPFNQSDPAYALFDLMVQKINRTINVPNSSYKVVDVYNEFKKNQYRLTVDSSFAHSLMGIHPDNKGHEIIFEAHRRIAAVPVDSIALDKTSDNLILGKTLKLSCTIFPTNAAYNDIIWTSSSNEVASVDEDGNITAKAPGNVVIKATVKEIDKTASCSINVIVPVESISLNKTTERIDINGEIMLDAVVSPSNATTKDILWKSSDEAVAVVDSSGRVKGLMEGTASIIAVTVDGNKEASSTVNVIIPVENISLDKTWEKINENSEVQLKAAISPPNASIKDVIWKSSDKTIAIVDSNGKVKGLKAGSAIITATSSDKNKTVDCTVIVNPKSGFTMNFLIIFSIGAMVFVSGVLLKAKISKR